MTIVVREGVASMLRSAEGHPAALQIDCAERPAEAVAALPAARADIARLAPAEAPVAIEGPIPVPGGYLYWVDFGSATSPARRAELPDILARHLEGAGIANAVIRPARRIGTRYEILNSFAPTVRTWLVGTNTEPVSGVLPSVPPVLVDLATQWLQARHDQNMELLAVILGLEIPLSPETLPLFPAYVRTAGFYTFATLATDFAATYASALFGQFRGTGVTLAEAGRPAAQAVALMRGQRELIRAHAHLAELEWAGVSAAGRTPRPLIGQATVRSYQMLGPVWYQLLSADQLRRPGPIQPGAIELPGGRVELTVGEPEQWLPGRLLAGFLRSGDAAAAMVAGYRPSRNVREAVPPRRPPHRGSPPPTWRPSFGPNGTRFKLLLHLLAAPRRPECQCSASRWSRAGVPGAMSQERVRRRHLCMRGHDKEAVVVIGAGLAGLTAAATAARARRPVVVVEAHTAGGRARTDELSGYRFNQGPHALGRGGEAWRILRDLGVPHRGHRPPLRGARVVRDGKLTGVPVGQLGLLVPRLVTASAARWAGRSAEEWVESLGGSRDLPDLARMLIRVTTYVTDLGSMPADFAIARLKGARRGVSYLDQGFASLVEGLWSAASAAGATIRTHQAAAGINAVPGGWEVALAGGEVLPAAAVIIAAGSPAAARKLLPVDPGWPELGPPVTAACLDLGLRGPHPSVVIGVDEPLYLARFCPPGDLAPAGGSVVHVMRYGARDAGLDRAELHRFAALAGITDDQIVAERFLAVHVVTHVLPGPEDGLAGRPSVAVPGSPGVYLAGDWVGPSGWLSDAATASGQHAGLLAAGAAEDRTYPRVA